MLEAKEKRGSQWPTLQDALGTVGSNLVSFSLCRSSLDFRARPKGLSEAREFPRDYKVNCGASFPVVSCLPYRKSKKQTEKVGVTASKENVCRTRKKKNLTRSRTFIFIQSFPHHHFFPSLLETDGIKQLITWVVSISLSLSVTRERVSSSEILRTFSDLVSCSPGVAGTQLLDGSLRDFLTSPAFKLHLSFPLFPSFSLFSYLSRSFSFSIARGFASAA